MPCSPRVEVVDQDVRSHSCQTEGRQRHDHPTHQAGVGSGIWQGQTAGEVAGGGAATRKKDSRTSSGTVGRTVGTLVAKGPDCEELGTADDVSIFSGTSGSA